MKFADWLKAQGWTQEEFDALDETKQKAMRACFDVDVKAQAATATVQASGNASPQSKAPAGEAEDLDALILDAKRKEAIHAMAAAEVRRLGCSAEDAERIKAIATRGCEEKWSTAKFETELLRASRVRVPSIHVVDATITADVLEAACDLRCGFDPKRDSQAHDAASRRFRGGIGLQELILAAAKANGYTGRDRIGTDNMQKVLAFAVPHGPEMIRAAFSTVDLSGILGNVANKALAAIAAEPNWIAPRIAAPRSHANFHSHTVYSMAMNGDLETVGATGELDNLDLSEESWSRQVLTKGAVLGISRRDIVNDDLGVFTRNAQALSRKALNAREKALFTAVNVTGAGSTHFTAARGNYLSGVAFGHAGMGLAIAAFRGLTDPAGDPMNVEPAVCLVTPTNEGAARTLLLPFMPLAVTGVTNSSLVQGGGNIYAGRFGGAPLVSPYLELASLTGYSTTAWYLLADPNILPCFEIAYLNGQETPVVEFFGLDTDPNTLGMKWRVYYDFGVAAAEWRAGVKSAGA